MGPAASTLGAEHVVEAEAGLVVEREIETERGGGFLSGGCVRSAIRMLP